MKKIPYRTITYIDLAQLLGKYSTLGDYDKAAKLMVDEELLILKKDSAYVKPDTVSTE
jgi:hypothetical protein